MKHLSFPTSTHYTLVFCCGFSNKLCTMMSTIGYMRLKSKLLGKLIWMKKQLFLAALCRSFGAMESSTSRTACTEGITHGHPIGPTCKNLLNFVMSYDVMRCSNFCTLEAVKPFHIQEAHFKLQLSSGRIKHPCLLFDGVGIAGFEPDFF